MIAGSSFLAASVAIVILLTLAGRSPHEEVDGTHIFRYPKAALWVLFMAIPFWVVAAVIVRYSARPGCDNAVVINIFVVIFLGVSLAYGVLYFYAKQFYFAINETTVRWRKFRATRSIEFSSLGGIEFKQLNGGRLERMSLLVDGRQIFEVTSTIQDFARIKMLMELNGRRYGIPIKRS